jgi:hypothetical protein
LAARGEVQSGLLGGSLPRRGRRCSIRAELVLATAATDHPDQSANIVKCSVADGQAGTAEIVED